MKTTEIRVRPVIRHIVTRYTQEVMPGTEADPRYFGGLETLGEFDNEAQAEQMAAALRAQSEPKDFVVVQRTFDIDAKVYYAYSQEEADQLVKQLYYDTAKEYRVYSRPNG